MREARIAAATRVASELFETERAIDELLAHAARLSAALPEARFQAKLSGVMGQAAIESSTELMSAVANARSIAVRLHGQLDDLKTDIGLRTVGMGGGVYKGMLASGETDQENIVPLRSKAA
jgi:hypothetical protein